MSYIDAYHDKDSDVINVVERDPNGRRTFHQYKPEYSFYYSDSKGQYKSIYGESVSLFKTNSQKTFRKELNKLGSYLNIYEGDISPVFKLFEKYYKDSNPPPLNVTFFDIEVDFDEKKGFSYPDDPFNEITAISLYNKWEGICYTLVKAPRGMDSARAQSIVDEFSHTVLCETEEEILRLFIELIDESDVLSGWNSEGYDIPYIVGRIIRVLGGDYARRLCHWNLMPKKRTFMRYEKEQLTFDLFGRVHLDYLNLYRTYTYHEMHSYSLDTIGEYEVGENKIAYEGSLDDLYKKEFKKFIEYNRQDTLLLSKIDDKMQLISLINTLAHQNCVPLTKTTRAVALTDSAIILAAHEHGVVIPNRDMNSDDEDDFVLEADDDSDEEEYVAKKSRKRMPTPSEVAAYINSKIAGAYVAQPVKGLTPWIGSVDITSLYPSIIMAMNISPETLAGQVDMAKTKKMLYDKMIQGETFADAWSGHFTTIETDDVLNNSKEKVTFYLEEAKKTTKTFNVPAHEVKEYVFNGPYCITANGTIFRHDIDGIIPELIAKWFKDRKEMQGIAGSYSDLMNGIEVPDDILKKLSDK